MSKDDAGTHELSVVYYSLDRVGEIFAVEKPGDVQRFRKARCHFVVIANQC